MDRNSGAVANAGGGASTVEFAAEKMGSYLDLADENGSENNPDLEALVTTTGTEWADAATEDGTFYCDAATEHEHVPDHDTGHSETWSEVVRK